LGTNCRPFFHLSQCQGLALERQEEKWLVRNPSEAVKDQTCSGRGPPGNGRRPAKQDFFPLVAPLTTLQLFGQLTDLREMLLFFQGLFPAPPVAATRISDFKFQIPEARVRMTARPKVFAAREEVG
jgi:hypothetical protein